MKKSKLFTDNGVLDKNKSPEARALGKLEASITMQVGDYFDKYPKLNGIDSRLAGHWLNRTVEMAVLRHLISKMV